MTGRIGSSNEHKGGNISRLLLIGALVLAVAATGVLVLSNDGRLLRLGIVAALWAALMGGFLATRYHRQVVDRDENAADMQAVYELELEREVSARREYELQIEAEVQHKAEESSREDLQALRDELSTLRETLQALLGGEVLVERFALQAEATRMRSLPEDARPLVARPNMVKRLNPSPREDGVIMPEDGQTELIEPVRRPLSRPPGPAKAGRGPIVPGSVDQTDRTDRTDRTGDREQHSGEMRRPPKEQQSGEIRRPPKSQRLPRELVHPARPAVTEDDRFDRSPAEESGQLDVAADWWGPAEQEGPGQTGPHPAASAVRRTGPEESSGSLADRLRLGWSKDQGFDGDDGLADGADQPPFPADRRDQDRPGRRGRTVERRTTTQDDREGARPRPPVRPGPPQSRDVSTPAEPAASGGGRNFDDRTGDDRTRFASPVGTIGDSAAPPGSTTRAGRRRAADGGEPPAAARSQPVKAEPRAGGGGGRRRIDDPPARQDVVEWRPNDDEPARGRNAGRPPAEERTRFAAPVGEDRTRLAAPVAGGRGTDDEEAAPAGRRARGPAKAPEEMSGSHAEGKSVTELLQAHGGTNGPRRRRRRDD